LSQRVGISRALGRIEDFDADDPALVVVVHDDSATSSLSLMGRSVRLR
jgi:hypothetical protein